MVQNAARRSEVFRPEFDVAPVGGNDIDRIRTGQRGYVQTSQFTQDPALLNEVVLAL